MSRWAATKMPIRSWDLTEPASAIRIRPGGVCQALASNGYYYDVRFHDLLENDEVLVEVLDGTSRKCRIHRSNLRPKERTWAIDDFHKGVEKALLVAQALLKEAKGTQNNHIRPTWLPAFLPLVPSRATPVPRPQIDNKSIALFDGGCKTDAYGAAVAE